MKALWITLALLLLPYQLQCASAANSILVQGAPADSLVNSLTALGLDQFNTHEYLQVGVTACSQLFDERGDYFSAGAVGDYIGESCLIYGDADGSDEDGALRTKLLIPANDRNLSQNPELKQNLEKLRSLREALEMLFVPLTRTVNLGGHEILVSQMTGISGIACEGHAQGVRQCWVKPSERCPPRGL